MKKSGILGVLFALILLATAAIIGGAGVFFFSTTTLMLTVGVPLGLAWATFGTRDYIRLGVVLSALFVNRKAEDVRPRDLAMIRALIHYTYAAAVVAMLLGLVNMCANLDEPSRIGAGMALSLLAPLYALVIAEIWCRPCLRRLEHLKGKPAPSDADDSSQSALTQLPGPLAALGLAFFVMLNFLILVLSFSTIAPTPM